MSGCNAAAPSATSLKQTPDARVSLGVRLVSEWMEPGLWHQRPCRLPSKDCPLGPLKDSRQLLRGGRGRKTLDFLVPEFPALERLILFVAS